MSEEKLKDEILENKNKSIAYRNIILTCIIIILSIIFSILLRAEYLGIKGIGEQYIDIFFTNFKNKLYLFSSICIITYIIIFISNKFIKHGLKKFFDDDKKQIPKLPSKTFAIIGALFFAIIGTIILNEKYIMFINVAWFGKTDPVFNVDISYYIFTLPFIESTINFVIFELICLIIYISSYYVIVMNTFLDGVDIELLKKNTFIKQIVVILVVIAFLFCVRIFINSQNVLTQDMLALDGINLTGAGKTEVTLKLWGYRIFSIILFISIIRLLRYILKGNFKQSMISISVVPIYLIVMFICMVYYDEFIVKNDVLDNQKEYISHNIRNTKEAFGINIDQKMINSYDTIKYDEIAKNSDVISNIPIISKDIILLDVDEHQEDGVYYSYENTYLGLLNSKLVYFTPREILSNSNMSYNNRTFKYTHGYSLVINSASNTDENGYAENLLSNYVDEKNYNINQPRIYFGLETNSAIVVNSKFGNEYDYPITATNYEENNYDGKSGLKLGFFDRLVLGIANKNLKLAFSGYLNDECKIISNRNIIDRAKSLLPYLIYDEEPYLVITDEGKLVWVLDGYTISNEYPYSQMTSITINGQTQNINYIRNSVKVLIDSYDGTTQFYITDRNDPIIMSYKNLYPTLFKDLNEKIPEDIAKQFKYPKLLYKVQAKMISIYHDISEDVLYRADDIWEIAPTETKAKVSLSGKEMEPYYTMLKTKNSKSSEFGLVIMFNKKSKQNITAYMVGTYNDGIPKLSLYKFDSESNVAGIVQLNTQIELDETISSQLESLNVTGTKIIKNLIIVPINDTLLYVEPVYQVRLNESEIPILKKIIVASGNKLAIGSNLNDAISNLFTDYAVDLEIVDMQDINSVIDAIIKSNNNLEESLNSNDLEMIGKDLKELENLIKRLQELRENQLKDNKEEKIDENEYSKQINDIQNDISTSDINNSIFTY